ncbi:MAG: hypothetical protein M0R74_14370 [Dehalococcoidia bacterium]|nr:hypothetical protein [Dehalococcoidia bacterium]
MSQLQKKIQRIQRRENSRGFGFGQAAREQPAAMLLGAIVNDAATAKAAVEAGADVVLFQGKDAQTVAPAIRELNGEKLTAGAWVETLDESGAASLRDAGCDFAISTLEATSSAAVDTDAMGQVIVVSPEMDDTTLRALGPLSLDALFVERPLTGMTLKDQLALVRLASFASTPLLVSVAAEASPAELRVLRDSGTALVVPPAGTAPDALAKLLQALKDVPAPRRGRRESGEIAIVPSVPSGHDHDDNGDDE